jgi:hypothetical protein
LSTISPTREGIYAVVTYNFDDLLERALTKAEIRCRPIYEEGTVPDPDELPIYHVHGRLPKHPLPEASPRLIFSEESYFALESDHYSWANFEQLKLLRETTCLLVGLSGTDPNLRRLLDIDFRQSKRAKHYLCLRRQNVRDLLGSSTQVRSTVAQHFLNVHHTFIEHSFADLGLNVIWFDEYSELPGLLEQVRTHSQLYNGGSLRRTLEPDHPTVFKQKGAKALSGIRRRQGTATAAQIGGHEHPLRP